MVVTSVTSALASSRLILPQRNNPCLLKICGRQLETMVDHRAGHVEFLANLSTAVSALEAPLWPHVLTSHVDLGVP